MFFDSWQDIFRILLLGTVGYTSLIVVMRFSGKRTLSKMNMFDFIVTIALGSLFASMLLFPTVTLSEGLTAMILLTVLQLTVAWLASRSDVVSNLVKGQPTLVYYQGAYLTDAMKQERVEKEDLRYAARLAGVRDMNTVGAIIIESTGEFAVIRDYDFSPNMLRDVEEDAGK